MKFCKRYRRAFEIIGFAQRIQRNDKPEHVARHGEEPKIVRFDPLEVEIGFLGWGAGSGSILRQNRRRIDGGEKIKRLFGFPC